MKRLATIVALLISAACSQGDEVSVDSAKDSMAGMPGMSAAGGMTSAAMMDSMTAHITAMDTASASTMQTMLPAHRQAVANMIAQMNAEMRGMNMSGDARWTALMDSVRQDLVRMPEMNAEQLKANAPAHHGRLARLMQSHRDMMKGMKM